MHILVDSITLNYAIQTITKKMRKAVDMVYFSIQGDSLLVTAGNFRGCDVSMHVPITDNQTNGSKLYSFNLSTKRLLKLLPTIKGLTTKIELNGKNVILSDGTGMSPVTLSIPIGDDNFQPIKVNEKETSSYTVVEYELYRALTNIKNMMGVSDVRYYLNGMLFETTDTSLILVATDGQRLGLSMIERNRHVNESNGKLVMLREAVLTLLGLLKKNGTREIYFSYQPICANEITIIIDDVKLVAPVCTTPYPEYKRVIPTDLSLEVTVSTEELQDVVNIHHALQQPSDEHYTMQILPEVKNGALALSKYTQPIKESKKIGLSARPPLIENTQRIGVYANTGNFTMGVHVTYLRDAIHNISTDKVTLYTPLSCGSLVIKDSHKNVDNTYVVMPVRLRVA